MPTLKGKSYILPTFDIKKTTFVYRTKVMFSCGSKHATGLREIRNGLRRRERTCCRRFLRLKRFRECDIINSINRDLLRLDRFEIINYDEVRDYGHQDIAPGSTVDMVSRLHNNL
jgi:hypothetical protein